MTIEATISESRVEALCALAAQTRELMDAVAMTGVGEQELAAVTAELRALTERLDAAGRTSPHPFEIRADGTVRTLGNAVIGAGNPFAFPLVVEHVAEGRVRAEVAFRPLHEGPPGGVHGGITAMVLDHMLGQAAAVAGYAGVTATLTMSYRAPVPYGTPVVATAEHTRAEGRKSWSDGRISLPDGTLLVEATGLFVTPAAWLRGDGPRGLPDGGARTGE